MLAQHDFKEFLSKYVIHWDKHSRDLKVQVNYRFLNFQVPWMFISVSTVYLLRRWRYFWIWQPRFALQWSSWSPKKLFTLMWYVFLAEILSCIAYNIEQLQRLNFLILLYRLLAIALLVTETLSNWLTSHYPCLLVSVPHHQAVYPFGGQPPRSLKGTSPVSSLTFGLLVSTVIPQAGRFTCTTWLTNTFQVSCCGNCGLLHRSPTLASVTNK